MSREYTTVLYSSFHSIILSESDLRSQVCAFITQKSTELFTLTLDIYQNSNIQAITVSKLDLLSMFILNIYNKKSEADFSF